MSIEGIDVALCGQCNIATYGRRFYFHANLPLFRRLYRSGIVYAVDRSTTPWGATLFDVATQPESEFYVELDRDYHDALAYYDNVVGAAEHQSLISDLDAILARRPGLAWPV